MSDDNNIVSSNPAPLALTPEEQKLIMQARQSSGEGVRLNIKYVSFNKQEGKWYESTGQKDEKGKTIQKPLGEEYSGVVIKNRNRVNVFAAKKPLETYRSDEFDDVQSEVISVYNGNNICVGTGTYKDLKMKIPGIKLEKVLYIKEANSDTIVKMSVKGTAIKPWFDYLKSFSNEDTSIRYVTHFNKGALQDNPFGAKYYLIQFSKGQTIDLREALGWLNSLNIAINTLGKSRVPNVNTDNDPSEQLEVIEVMEDGQDAIKPEDIPF
jgi:hypothetical protein